VKEKISKTINLIKKYLPDLLFLLGVLIVSYNFLRPSYKSEFDRILNYDQQLMEHKVQVLGIILVALAIDIAIRRYFKCRKYL